MSILVVGSVAFDNLKTPFGEAERCLGGSATYFSVAASFFTEVDLVAVVGDDFSEKDLEIFRGRRINTDGLERIAGGKTFVWSGEYGYDLNVAKTLDTRLNVFGTFDPKLNDRQRSPPVRSRASSIRRAPATRSPAVSSATSPRAGNIARPSCGERSSSAACSRRSPSRSSHSTDCARSR